VAGLLVLVGGRGLEVEAIGMTATQAYGAALRVIQVAEESEREILTEFARVAAGGGS
jgi:hypothetical protein